MTLREFTARMEVSCDVALLIDGRDRARRRLDTARRHVRAAAGRAPSVRKLAALELDRAVVLAEEWGVVGKAGRS